MEYFRFEQEQIRNVLLGDFIIICLRVENWNITKPQNLGVKPHSMYFFYFGTALLWIFFFSKGGEITKISKVFFLIPFR